MAQYAFVPKSLYESERFLNLDATAQRLALYLLVAPRSRSEGLSRFRPEQAALDLRITPEEVGAAIPALEPWFARFDGEAGLVLVVDALKWSSPSTERQLKGALSAYRDYPPSPLFDDLIDLASRYAPQQIDIMAKNEKGRWVKSGETTTLAAEIRALIGELSDNNATPNRQLSDSYRPESENEYEYENESEYENENESEFENELEKARRQRQEELEDKIREHAPELHPEAIKDGAAAAIRNSARTPVAYGLHVARAFKVPPYWDRWEGFDSEERSGAVSIGEAIRDALPDAEEGGF